MSLFVVGPPGVEKLARFGAAGTAWRSCGILERLTLNGCGRGAMNLPELSPLTTFRKTSILRIP